MSLHNRALGDEGEALAAEFLVRRGFKILERNFRCRVGEIDIVARDDKTIVFVEVKARKNRLYGTPQLSVTPFKQRQISKAALTWLAKKGQLDVCARFDVISITFVGQEPRLEHIPNAFDLAY